MLSLKYCLNCNLQCLSRFCESCYLISIQMTISVIFDSEKTLISGKNRGSKTRVRGRYGSKLQCGSGRAEPARRAPFHPSWRCVKRPFLLRFPPVFSAGKKVPKNPIVSRNGLCSNSCRGLLIIQSFISRTSSVLYTFPLFVRKISSCYIVRV